MPYMNPEKRREYQREWIKARRAEWFASRSCVRCGSTDRLELDHVDPSQKVDHKVWSWSAVRREVELAKCQALCHECHKVKSSAEATVYPDHGTRKRYRKGCKCDPCMAANAAYAKGLRGPR